MHLSLLDGVMVAVFFACILALGFSARLRDNSMLQYLAAGRALAVGPFVATLVCTWYGGILGVGESVSYYGVGTWLLLGVPYYVFAVLYAFYFAERVRGAEQISIPERLANRWGKTAGLVAAGLVFLLAVPAAHVLMLGVLLNAITGIAQWKCIVLAAFVGSLFLYRGGLLADVRASMLAFITMYLGFAVMVGFCLWHYPPGQTFSHLDPKLLTFTGGQGPVTIIGFFLLGAWTMVDPGFHQRVASAESPRASRKGTLICVFFWFIFDMLSMAAGLYAIALLNPKTPGLRLFPDLGDHVLPSGLKGLFLCGMLGTILCAMVGYTLVSGATLGRDLAGRIWPESSEATVKQWIRVGIVAGCLVAVLLALYIDSVVDLWYQWGGAVIGALLLPVSAAYLPAMKLRASPKWVVASMTAAFFISFAWLVYGKRTDHPDLSVKIAGVDVPIGTLVPGLIISALVLLAGQLVARTENIEANG
jgi:SSS family solute:Na+ symporter